VAGDSEIRDRVLALVHVRLERFAESQDPAVVLDATALAEVAALLDETPRSAADLEVALAAGLVHWCRYLVLDQGEDERDLAAALELLEPVYHARPGMLPDKVREFFDSEKMAGPVDHEGVARRGVGLLHKAQSTGSMSDLSESIDLLRQVLAAGPDVNLDRAALLSILSAALQTRFDWSGRLADLDEAVTASREAVAATSASHPERAAMLSNLGAALGTRFQRSGSLTDLDEAISASRHALAAIPDDHRRRAQLLCNLGVALISRFERSGSLADLDAAITTSHQAVDATPSDHPDRGLRLANLGAALHSRFERSGSSTDLDQAITTSHQAVDATPSNDPYRVQRLANLSAMLHSRFERSGSPADLDQAIAGNRQALAATPDDHPARPAMLSNLSLALHDRFGRTGSPADLDETITASRQAVNATPDNHPDHPRRLSNLGIALRARFERSGSPADLDQAITVGRQAVAATPGDHPERALRLSNLGVVLQTRFGQSGALTDLDEAVIAGCEALTATPGDHPGRAGLLSNLCIALRARFERSGSPADLDEAITVGRQAVTATPGDHPERSARLANLAAALWTRSDRSGTQADLDEAISTSREALTASTGDYPGRAAISSNLGLALRTRFDRSGSPADLDEAIIISRQAVAATPEDQPGRAARMLNLATTSWMRFELAGAPADLDEAITARRQAVAVDTAPPRIRVRAAAGWAELAGVAERWHEAVTGFETAVSLLGLIAPRSLVRRDQEHALGGVEGLASDAAACCVAAGLTDRAVELLEQGRAVLLGQALDTRTDLTDLAEQHPALAQRFITLRDALDQINDPTGNLMTLPGLTGQPSDLGIAMARLEADRQRASGEAFEHLIGEIRNQRGFGGFLRPLPVGTLLGAAEEGPVVTINVSRYGSHALILTADGVLDPVPLPEVTPSRVFAEVSGLLTALGQGSTSAQAEARLAGTLGWLWDTIASPVLNRLGLTGPPQDGLPWPRLWWCLPGLLAFLPLHAAGHHDTSSDAAPQTVMDRAISSYTPTIRALLHARTARPDQDRTPARQGQVLAVAMHYTPGAPPLPGARAEASMLRDLLGPQVNVLADHEATRDAVARALPAARWAHFACHASANPDNPSASCLHLAHRHQLTVTDIARLRLRHADLAYLSACSTAQPGARLTDEAIHLASAFQLAGYQHVIGTLWSIPDHPAAQLASDIYTNLTRTPTATSPAHALHTATRRLRNLHINRATTWASHIHSGT